MMQILVGLGFLLVTGVWAASDCPDADTTLANWSSSTTWDDGLPATGSVVEIDQGILLDVTDLKLSEIRIVGDGRLVFSDQVGDISIVADGITVQDRGSLVIGSESCRFQNNVNIKLNGSRTTDRNAVGEKGEKFIFVTDEGSLQIYGKDKLAWTKINQTVNRWQTQSDHIVYDHATSEYADFMRSSSGPAMYIFDADTLEPRYFKVFGINANGDEKRETYRLNLMLNALNDVQDGEIVAIATQRNFQSSVDLETLLSTLESVADIDHIALRDIHETDAYALVFQKGGAVHESFDIGVGKKGSVARANIVVDGKKISAVSCIRCNEGVTYKPMPHFQIIDESVGFPTLSVVHNVSSWEVGDEVIVTSTDFNRFHTEVRTIKEVSSNSIKLSDELEYRHFGEIEEGVDMRAEVALLTRNIRIGGIMSRDCPKENKNCDEFEYDTYGAHIKIMNFSSIHIEGAELMNVGQATDKGHYPIHFHMCEDVSDKEAVIKSNTIRNSYARAVTVHGTYGQTEDKPGVVMKDNVAFDIIGHAYFLEDGAEKATILEGNLGATIKQIKGNGFDTDASGPSVFWITNPKVKLTNNVAVGGDVGYWYVFPEEPVGPSAELGVYQYREAPHTPLWTFDNNIAHSNNDAGFKFDNILEDENGKIGGCMNYKSVINPLNKTSADVKVQLTRFTAYKNKGVNTWFRGGWIEVVQYSCADSRKGLTFARGSNQQQFVKKSIIIGRSQGNHEDENYPDVPTDVNLYLGAVFRDGPVYLDGIWFNGFENNVDGKWVAGALGFAPKTKVSSSVMSTTGDLRFGFVDKGDGSGGNRVFDGMEDDSDFGFGNFDGDESATFRDGDGSVTQCSDEDWSQPIQIIKPEKYTVTENCVYRENWQMVVCEDNYGKLRTDVLKVFNGKLEDFRTESQARRLNRLNSSDIAYEDHTGERRSEYMAVLGSDKYYYQIQFLKEFPQRAEITGKGLERGYPVVAGLCLPAGLGPEDIKLNAWRPPGVRTNPDDWIIVDTIDELFNDTTQTRVFLDGRILHVRLMNTLSRNENWDRVDTDHCPSGQCPYFNIEILSEITDYTPCFTPTGDELNTDVHVDNVPKMSCDMPASTPDEDWGAGDTLRSAEQGQWGEWSSWSDCCVGQDTETARYRLCDNPPRYGSGPACPGISTESDTCTTECPVDGQLTEWTRWTDCFCDGIAVGSSGAKTRQRQCNVAHGGEICADTLIDIGSCYGDCE